MKSIFKKQEALNIYSKLKSKDAKSSLMLFQEDIDKAGTKKFYVTDPKLIFTKIEKTAEPHFYEFWSDKTKMCFGVDIDYDKTSSEIEPDTLVKNVIKTVIDGAKKYYNYEYKISDIIVLENDKYLQEQDNPKKYSSHIIFRGLNFENVTVCKDFFLRLNKDYEIEKMHVDKAIYNLTCLRLYLNSKMGKTAILVPKCVTIDKKKTCMPSDSIFKDNSTNSVGGSTNLYKFFLKTMLTHTISTDQTIGVKDIKNKTKAVLPKQYEGSNNISNINIDHILESLPEKYHDEYDLWVKIGMILYQYHSDKFDTFTLWDNWSQKSAKYKQKEMAGKWKSFSNANSKISIGTLIKWAKDEGIENIYKTTSQSTDSIVQSYPIKPININLDNIKESQLTRLSQAKLTPEIYEPLMKTKLVAVQSEKGTGKTSNLFKTMFENNNSWINDDTSILFVSGRVTFGYKLLGDLKEYGFELYSQVKDQQIYSKRIICQIDSLMRLERDSYDIIIIDECESLARYITSSHFTKNSKSSMIVENLELRISDANQVYILDADLSDRCINYYKKIVNPTPNNFHLVINDFKPYADYKLIYSAYATWIRQIRLKIQDNKRIVVATASNAKAKDLDHMLKEYFPEKKILLIHKETSDEDKKNLLLNVNEEWSKYDVVIYTPSVCMGVSFDIDDHFDYIFAYGCHESLGAQEWCQMIHRIRNPNNKDIYMSIDQYKQFNEDEDTITYKTVEKMLCSDYYLTNYDLHNNLVQKKIKRIKTQEEANRFNNIDSGLDEDDQVIGFNDTNTPSTNSSLTKTEVQTNVTVNDTVLYYPYKFDPVYDLYVRNSWEQIENKLNFPASFFGYAKFKEYQLEYLPPSEEDKDILREMKDIRAEREDQELEEKINGIISAEDIDREEYNNKVRQRDEFLTKEDRYAMQKFNLRNCYNIKMPEIINEDAETENVEAKSESEETETNKTLENGFITREFVAEYHQRDRMKWYRNLSTILAIDEQKSREKLAVLKDNQQYESIISNCYLEFTTKNKYVYHYYATEIIKLCGFDINDLSIRLSYPNLITNIYDVIAWCDERKDDIAFKYDLKITHKSLTDLSEVEQMKYINRIIESQYGLKIKRENTSADKDNIMYKLDDGGIWENLPERDINIIKKIALDLENSYSDNDSDSDNENNENKDTKSINSFNALSKNVNNLKRKIVPIQLKQKRNQKYQASVDDFDDDDDTNVSDV
jgi:hypothetical protein